MTNRRAKLAAGATVVGLAGLGAAALGTNHGLPASAQRAAGGSTAVVTSASGASAASSSQAVAPQKVQPPIVTRVSGGALSVEDD